MAPYRKQVLHHFIHYNRNAYLGDSVSYAVLRQGNNASWCCRKLACNNIGRYWGNIRDLILQNLRNVRFCVVHLSYIFCSSNSFERIDEAKHLHQCIWKNYITIIWSGFCFNSAHAISCGHFVFHYLISSSMHCHIWIVTTHVTSTMKDICDFWTKFSNQGK